MEQVWRGGLGGWCGTVWRFVAAQQHFTFRSPGAGIRIIEPQLDDLTVTATAAARVHVDVMAARLISFYAGAIRPHLPRAAFLPAHTRLFWLPVHVLVVVLGIVSLAAEWVPMAFAAAVSVSIGASFAGLTFLAHETLHGAVVRGRTARQVVGTVCFWPFMIAPRLWTAWHNRVHHGSANRPGVDPDTYPTLEQYRKSRVLRFVTDHLGPGRSRPHGVLSLLIGFSVQSGHMLLCARNLGLLSVRQQRLAMFQSGLAAISWLALAAFAGWPTFLFGFVVPLLLANAIVMAFIFTNHSVSPHTEVNDPLLNTLSVTVPRWADWWTLQFGFHVEHHLFPSMSSRHAGAVRSLVRARWPERYQSMPLGRALLMLHRTGRVYKDATTLVDVPRGKESPTLLPREEGSGVIGLGSCLRPASPISGPRPTAEVTPPV